MPTVTFRRALASDYPQILQLQSANFIANLAAEERKQGFLSAQFSAAQTAEIAEDLGTMLAFVDDRVVGFLCAFRNEFQTGSPVIARMLESYDRLLFQERPLRSFKSYIYGPVCISRDYRQRGLLRGLYGAQKNDLSGRYDLGVAFVSRNNPHSLQAHVAGLGMCEVGDFEAADNIYVVLTFPLAPNPSR